MTLISINRERYLTSLRSEQDAWDESCIDGRIRRQNTRQAYQAANASAVDRLHQRACTTCFDDMIDAPSTSDARDFFVPVGSSDVVDEMRRTEFLRNLELIV
jgi:hypothetical protein